MTNAWCECGAKEQSLKHILLDCASISQERQRVQWHLDRSEHRNLELILQGGQFRDKSTKDAYLSDLQVLIEAGLELIWHSCPRVALPVSAQ